MSHPVLPETLIPFRRILALVFLSGACALVYQIVWTRTFRLVFGASTPASAAVVAIFVGGLGLGAWLFGKRVDRLRRPITSYAALEAAIALSSALTLVLGPLASRAYVLLGGTVVLGMAGATVVRLLLAALVLAVPTILMGGTLPVLARATALGADGDVGRRRVALLYGVNTLGAVGGCLVADFVLIEHIGADFTLVLAVFCNILVALGAAFLARRSEDEAGDDSPVAVPAAPQAAVTRPAFVYAAAAVTGFAFFLMELVFYRMLVPLLGGTVYTFGLVLATALLGMGTGGALYAVLFARRPPRLSAFAATCLLEAAGLALPYALGDRLALLAILLRPLGELGLGGYAAGWFVVAAAVVLPASIATGIQFPMLVALLGRGGRDVARHVGLAYAWNTIGAIAGALAGGFGLMPLLTATGCWRDVVWLLVLTGLVAAAAAWHRERRWPRLIGLAAIAFLAIGMVRATTGPTAAWRHTPIGAGRVSPDRIETPEKRTQWMRDERRGLAWEADGIESTVALEQNAGYAFLTNGKSDGGCRDDAGTQVMGGLLGAILHPAPTSAMVIGLGSGSSAGWLASVPGIDRVDVVELEPAMLEVARRCALVNEHALENPKLRVIRGDAREILSVTRDLYDIIFSEPSNPYRAGVASLYTREYYARARAHLREGGLFLQWVQAYEVEATTLRTIFATMASEFPEVEAWQLEPADLLLVGSTALPTKDAAALRARVASEPFARALRVTWAVVDLEGVLAHYVATPNKVRSLGLENATPLNTDDRPVVEFGFARSVGDKKDESNELDVKWVRLWAEKTRDDMPIVTGDVDVDRVRLIRAEIPCVDGHEPYWALDMSVEAQKHQVFEHEYHDRHGKEALAEWDSTREPATPIEALDLAEAAVSEKDPRAAEWVQRLASTHPIESMALQARMLMDDKRNVEAAELLERVLVAYRSDPWLYPPIMSHAVFDARFAAIGDRSIAARMIALLSVPFAVELNRDSRLQAAVSIASFSNDMSRCRELLQPLEPNTPWRKDDLEFRRDCYRDTADPRAALAERELATFLREETGRFGR